jgi:Asp-tRNA(Asn)/Glu-tRNA(Gln) amidotransferase A subunit family amidase
MRRRYPKMYRKTRDRGFGAEGKRRIMLGTYALSAGYYDAYYLQAQKVRTLLASRLSECVRRGGRDQLRRPLRRAAFKLGEKGRRPVSMYSPISLRSRPTLWNPGISGSVWTTRVDCRSECRSWESTSMRERFSGWDM